MLQPDRRATAPTPRRYPEPGPFVFPNQESATATQGHTQVGEGDYSACRARWTLKSFTLPLTPLSRRAPIDDQVKSAALPTASRVESATATVPGRAAAVTRLATLTGLPNQSPRV